MITITQLNHPKLQVDNWLITQGETWCVLTKNGCGEEHLLAFFADELADVNDVQLDSTAVISFHSLQQVFEHELDIDETDLTDELDFGTKLKEFLPEQEHDNKLIDTFNMRHRMETGFRLLSTGESRKLQILKALLEGNKVLVLEDPFEALDKDSVSHLSQVLDSLNGISIIMLLKNHIDIPDWCQHYALLENGKLETLTNDASLANRIDQYFQRNNAEIEWPEHLNPLKTYHHQYLCRLNNLHVMYGGKPILHNINLTIAPLQHTLVKGKNGSGKSTLLQIITGDCPQVFANDVTVFGYKRGSGESIWDIKQHIGIISSELHRMYRVSCNVKTAVGSGFNDSIGLYKQLSKKQWETVLIWLEIVGLAQHMDKPFRDLSHGEQRLVLIARALVKSPLMLIMDEPTQGLDEMNRELVLSFLKKLASSGQTTILYVSHREDEHLPLFEQVLEL